MKGHFIVLEGIDGCGKSTQINHLSKWLPTSGLMHSDAKLIITKEPGGTILGSSLRQLLLNPPEGKAPEPLTELLLYAADRAQHLNQLILPAIENGHWIISDRFSGSTLAYQGFGRNLDISLIKQLENIATLGIKPDITIFLNISVNESIKRRINEINDRIESEGSLFLQRVAKGFSEIAKDRKWINVDANQETELVSRSIENHLTSYIRKSSLN